MSITAAEVARLGALARIQLSAEECAALAPELDVILGAVRRVSEVAGAQVPMATHALPLTNVFRADEVQDCLTPQQALSGAPDQEDGRFRVPQILSED